MKKIAVLLLFSCLLLKGFPRSFDKVMWNNLTLPDLATAKMTQPKHPHILAGSPGGGSETAYQIKLQAINEVFEKRIKAVKSGSENQYITKDRQIQILTEQRDGLVRDLLTRRDKR